MSTAKPTKPSQSITIEGPVTVYPSVPACNLLRMRALGKLTKEDKQRLSHEEIMRLGQPAPLRGFRVISTVNTVEYEPGDLMPRKATVSLCQREDLTVNVREVRQDRDEAFLSIEDWDLWVAAK